MQVVASRTAAELDEIVETSEPSIFDEKAFLPFTYVVKGTLKLVICMHDKHVDDTQLNRWCSWFGDNF